MIRGGGSLGAGEVMAASLALACVLVPLARRLALRLGVVDHPVLGQKMHPVAVPYLGGAAVALATLAGAVTTGGEEAAGMVLPAVAVATIGLWDDVRTSSPQLRLAVEALAAAGAWRFTPLHAQYPGTTGLAATVVCIVLVANCFNLIDNSDGCAGAVGVAMTGGLLVAGLMLAPASTPVVAAALVGALLGFLIWNWHPARIFMGDAGSLFLGFLVAELVLRVDPHDRLGGHAVVVLLFVAPVLFDTTLVVVSRVRAGRSILIGGCDHTAHRLKRLGIGTSTVATILGVAGAVCAGMAVAVSKGTLEPSYALLILAGAAAGFLVEFLRIPVYGPSAGEMGQPADERLGISYEATG